MNGQMAEIQAEAVRVAGMLRARRATVAVAESSAGGLISAALLAIPGASDYFLGGGVIYTRQARDGLLGLTGAELEGVRSATEPYAALLAGRLRERLGADWALAETGASGPSGNRYGDPPGHTALAVLGDGGPLTTVLRTGLEDRGENMCRFAAAALAHLARCLEQA